MSKLNPKLLEVLACPITKTELEYDEKNNFLISRTAGLKFPIREGIPIMIIDEAEKL